MSVQPRSDNEDDKGADEWGKDDDGENFKGGSRYKHLRRRSG